MQKPISPTAHATLDYGLAALQLVGPRILGLNKRARMVGGLIGTMYGATAAMTDTPLGVTRTIPFRVHGMLEGPSLPALLAVPLAAGALDSPRARTFFLTCFGMTLANFLLTDFSAGEHAIGKRRNLSQELEPIGIA